MLRFCLLVVVLVPCSVDGGDDREKKEFEKLQGEWEVTSLIYNGKDFFAGALAPFEFHFKKDEVVVQGNDKVKLEYARLKLKLVPDSMPPLADLAVTAGIQKDSKMEGIYELKDGQLKLCLRVFGTDRPTEFSAPAGSSTAYLVLKKK